MLPRISTERKARAVRDGRVNRAVVSTLGLCALGTTGVSFDLMADTLSAAKALEKE